MGRGRRRAIARKTDEYDGKKAQTRATICIRCVSTTCSESSCNARANQQETVGLWTELMKKTVAELRGELACLDAKIKNARQLEIDPALNQIVDLMAQWSISISEIDRFQRGRFHAGTDGASRHDDHDPELTRFLVSAIEHVLSTDITPPSCPRCTSFATRLVHRASPSRALPYFVCDTCHRGFTRTQGTPLHSTHKRNRLIDFARCLSQRRTLDAVAAELGMKRHTVDLWVRRFRAWLLVLDPSGDYAARVRLGRQRDLPPAL